MPSGLYALLTVLLLLIGSAASAQISGVVYRDYNANGTRQTPGEIGVGGVTVRVTGANGVTATATTSSVIVTTATTGTYSVPVTGLTAPYRVQFFNLPAGYYTGPKGTGSGTTVQYVTATAGASNINLGVNHPSDYCQSSPDLVTSCYVFGDQVAGTFNGSPALVSFPYTAGSSIISVTALPQAQTTTNGIYDQPTSHSLVLTASRVGTTFGSAYARTTDRLYAGAYFKKHAGFGPGATASATDDAGAIYVINPVSNTVITTFTVPNATSNLHNTADYNRDNGNTGWDAVGKSSLGGMDLSDNDQTLYVVNLQNRVLYALNATTGAVSTSAALSGTGFLPGTNCAACTATNDIRPFAVEFHRGRVYVGFVFTAETTVVQANMRAYIYSADAATLAFRTTPDFIMNLDYPRGKAATTGPADWRPWRPTYTNISTNQATRLVYPMPMFTGIAFDNDNLIIGLRDRMGDIAGNQSLDNPATSDLYQARTAGDILRAFGSLTTGWTLESNGRSNGLGGARQNTNQGPGGAEFYQGDSYPASSSITGTTTYTAVTPTASGTVTGTYTLTLAANASTVINGNLVGNTQGIQGFGRNHDEVSLGTMTQVPGFADVAAVVFDPLPDNGDEGFFDGGIRWLSNTTGSWVRGYRIFNGDGDAVGGDFGKASGLGDILAMCDPAPIEVGNRIWLDGGTNGTSDGLQGTTGTTDGIGGVEVLLYEGATLVGSTTSAAGTGEYYFNNTNVTTPGGLKPNTAYQIRIAQNQSVLTGLTPVTANVGTDDELDSDGVTSGANVVINFTTGDYGQNNHTYDFGFVGCPTITNLVASQSVVCSGTPVTTLRATTTAIGTEAIEYVAFVTPQSGTAVYTGGIVLGTATPTSGSATLTNVALPTNTGTTPITYYIYALVATTPNSPDCYPSAVATVIVRPIPVGTATTSGTITCAASATVLGSSSLTGSTFAWNGPGGFSSTAQSFTTTTPGTYTLVVTANGCSDPTAETTVVTQNVTTPQGVAASNTGPLNCTNITATVSASSTTGGVSYRWSGPSGFTSTAQSFATSVAGLYSVTVTAPSTLR